MKTAIAVLSVTLLLALGFLSLVHAQTDGPAKGIDVVEVIKATATVEKVDLENRKVTLLMQDGKKKTFKADKSVRNLDQVNVGDHLKLTYTEEMIVVVGKSNDPVGAASVGAVSVAPRGAKPGMVMVDTTVMNGKILAVNTQKYRVTVEEPDGKKRTIKVSRKVNNLEQLKAGDTFTMAVTESLLIEVVK